MEIKIVLGIEVGEDGCNVGIPTVGEEVGADDGGVDDAGGGL